MATINFDNKEAISEYPSIPEKNKVTDANINLIKQVGNQILTTLGVYTDTWDDTTTYLIDDVVVYDNRYFKNLTGTNTSTPPDEDTTNWLEVSLRDISGGAEIPIQNTAPANPREDDLWIDTSEEGFDNSNVVNEYSESDTDVYSCDYVNEMDKYSTIETKTNKVWTDGKPIYRKVLSGTLPTGAGSNSFASAFTTGDMIINVSGMVKSSYNSWWGISTYFSENAYNISYRTNATRSSLTLECGANYSTSSQYIIIVEYTKGNS